MAESWICRCSRGTLYDVLQVSPWCEPEVIQAAYRALARSRHPDVNREPDAEDQMRRLNAAYHTLSDQLRRARYDEDLALEAAGPIAGRSVPRTVEAPWPSSPAASTMTAEPPTSSANRTPGARRATPAGDRASGERVSPTRAMFMDAADGPALPRSALYVSVVLVTAIVVLVLWLIIDALVDRQTPSFRAGYGEERSLLNAPSAPWSFNVVAPSQNPGLSR